MSLPHSVETLLRHRVRARLLPTRREAAAFDAWDVTVQEWNIHLLAFSRLRVVDRLQGSCLINRPKNVTRQAGTLRTWAQSSLVENCSGRGRNRLGYLRLCSIVAGECPFGLLRPKRGPASKALHCTFFFVFLQFFVRRPPSLPKDVFFMQPVSGWQLPPVPDRGQGFKQAVLEQSAAEADWA